VSDVDGPVGTAGPYATDDPFDQGGPRRVRTYAARRGRLSALTRDRLERLGVDRFLPPGPLDPARAFGRVAPLVLEVGSGHGAAAIAYAREHPGYDVLAVDVHTPGIARMLAAADAAGVPNLRVVHGDAVELLTTRIAPGQVAALHLFFPDPWPKNRHAKRRFVGARTLTLLASRLAADGHVLLATDQPAYAAHVRSEVAAHGAFVVRPAERPWWRPLDGFERKGVASGHPIVELRLDRSGAALGGGGPVERATRIELA
jgi:tRNA (guanine-N7-)-methyltransferase